MQRGILNVLFFLDPQFKTVLYVSRESDLKQR